LLRTATAARTLLLVGSAVAVAHTASIIAFSWFLAHSIAGLIAQSPLDELAVPLAATAASILARTLTQAALDALAVRGAAVVKSQLRRRVLAAIDRSGSRLLSRTSSTSVATLIGQGLDALDGYIGRYLPQLILTAVATPIIVLVLLTADLATGIAVILTLPLIPLFMILIGLATQAMQRRQWEALGTLSQGFLEVVRGLSTLMLFGRQHRQAERIASVTEQYRQRTMRVLRLSFLSGFALELAASLSVAVVAVSIGVRLIDGDIAFALGLFVLVLVPEAYLPLRQVGTQYHAAAEGIAAAEDVLRLLDEGADPTAIGAVERAARSPELHSRGAGSAHAGSRERGSAAALELRELTVRRGDLVVVDRLSARWESGAVVAITGPSGIGKSSLVAAILGLHDAEGELLMGGELLDAACRAEHIAWAPQRPELTEGTLDTVVSLGSAAPERARVDRALAWARLEGLPRDTVLGPAGDGLSGGQAQRLALARAAYRAWEHDCAIVVLDEPTSALDLATERAVLVSVRELAAEGRLVVVVSHREAVVAAADVHLDLARRASAVPS
jgi:ATP-binding cassette subfamily C protein CydD